jgi:hypothetical protein
MCAFEFPQLRNPWSKYLYFIFYVLYNILRCIFYIIQRIEDITNDRNVRRGDRNHPLPF